MKTSYLTFFLFFASLITLAQTTSLDTYINFDVSRNTVTIIKLNTCRDNIICNFKEDDHLIQSSIITSTPTIINLRGNVDEYTFEFYSDEDPLLFYFSNDNGTNIADRTPPILGIATLDDLDLKIRKAGGNTEILTTICRKYNNTDLVKYLINDEWIPASCYCPYYEKTASGEFEQTTSYDLDNMFDDYNNSNLNNQINFYCDDNINNIPIPIQYRLANPNIINEQNLVSEIIDNTTILSIYIFDIGGKMLSIKTKEDLINLPSGMYVIKSIENNEVKTYKYIKE